MIVSIAYLIMGIFVGILIKHEIDIRKKKKRDKDRKDKISKTANTQRMQQYDCMLESIRSINQSNVKFKGGIIDGEQSK